MGEIVKQERGIVSRVLASPTATKATAIGLLAVSVLPDFFMRRAMDAIWDLSVFALLAVLIWRTINNATSSKKIDDDEYQKFKAFKERQDQFRDI